MNSIKGRVHAVFIVTMKDPAPTHSFPLGIPATTSHCIIRV